MHVMLHMSISQRNLFVLAYFFISSSVCACHDPLADNKAHSTTSAPTTQASPSSTPENTAKNALNLEHLRNHAAPQRMLASRAMARYRQAFSHVTLEATTRITLQPSSTHATTLKQEPTSHILVTYDNNDNDHAAHNAHIQINTPEESIEVFRVLGVQALRYNHGPLRTQTGSHAPLEHWENLFETTTEHVLELLGVLELSTPQKITIQNKPTWRY